MNGSTGTIKNRVLDFIPSSSDHAPCRAWDEVLDASEATIRLALRSNCGRLWDHSYNVGGLGGGGRLRQAKMNTGRMAEAALPGTVSFRLKRVGSTPT